MTGLVIPLNEAAAAPEAANEQPAGNIAQLVALVRDDMERVNREILSRARSNVDLIPEIAGHLIDSGGKRLRPMLTLAAAQMCGYAGDHHITLATSVEFMHTATLLHDDVVDDSDMRRGRKSARMVWGNEASVLVGDFLLGQAFRMMVSTGSLEALEVLSDAASVIAEGEVLQLSTANNLETTEDEYLEVIRSKTAALFAAAAQVGPIIAGQDKSVVSAFRCYGSNLGLAFQLIDDALDYGGSSAKLGKNTGDDFREGKVTLPVVLAYRRGSDDDRAFWKSSLGRAGDEALERATSLLDRYDALADTVARARHYGEMARDALAPLPAGEHKQALLEAIAFCTARAH